jgi:hypothetical protein
MADQPVADDPILTAAVAMLGRTGARHVTIGYSDEHEPPVWFAAAQFGLGHEAAGAMTPRLAVLRLLDQVIDGGQCTHCKQPSGVVVEQGTMPLADAICWYQYDPEMQTFRRGCE